MEKNKVTTYLLYAIGEIFLVVIGILIAVQINSWATSQRNEELKREYLQDLISDLEQDSIALQQQLDFIEADMATLDAIRKRLSSPGVTPDTLRKIARYEFIPYFNPSNELNRSTLTALLSSGDIKLFDKDLRTKISGHNLSQVQAIRVMDKNVDIFLQNGIQNKQMGPSEHPITDSLNIRGKLLDQIWEQVDNEMLLTNLPHTLASKMTMQIIITDAKKFIQSETNELLKVLRAELVGDESI